MFKYNVEFSDSAKYHIKLFEKAGNKLALKKIDILLNEIVTHPRTGTGHPERLKGYGEIERWSRRIDKEHRLVYEIKEEVVLILIVSAYGHYDD